jgi:hypothetical protein
MNDGEIPFFVLSIISPTDLENRRQLRNDAGWPKHCGLMLFWKTGTSL